MHSISRPWLLVFVFVIAVAGGGVGQTVSRVPLLSASPNVTVGTAFTFQGQIANGSTAVNATCDFQFKLFDAATGGGQIGSAVNQFAVPVAAGLFSVLIDFGFSPFAAGEARWIETAVRCPGDLALIMLAPRQPLSPTPYSLWSSVAASAQSLQGNPVGAASPVNGQVLRWNGSQWLPSDVSAGTISGVTAGAGLTGGGSSGTIPLAVNTSTIQSRVTGLCGPGSALQQIFVDGSASCASITSAGGITEVIAGSGLSGGGGSGSVALQVNPISVQSRVTGTCGSGQAIMSIDQGGGVVCAAVGGGITGVTAGAGLTGGGTSGVVSLAVNTATLQSRLTGSCGDGIVGVASDGSLNCNVFATSGTLVLNTITRTISAAGPGSQPSVAIGRDGYPVFSFYVSTTADLVVAKCQDPVCALAPTVTTVDSAGDSGRFSSLAIGHDGHPVISYYEVVSANLKVAKCVDPACAAPATITVLEGSPITDSGQYSSLTIAGTGNPFIAFHDVTSSTIAGIACTNPACTGGSRVSLSPGAGATGQFARAVTDQFGNPLLAYWNATTSRIELIFCDNPGCSASETVILPSSLPAARQIDLALSSEGLPLIAVFSNSTPARLLVTRCLRHRCAAGPSSNPLVGGNIEVGSWPVGTAVSPVAVAIGADGNPAVAYWTNNPDPGALPAIRFGRCSSPSCASDLGLLGSTLTGVGSNADVARGVTTDPERIGLTIGLDGLPIIAYDGPSGIRVAFCRTPVCGPVMPRR